MDSILEMLGRWLIALLLVVILLPVIWLVTSPFILIGAGLMPGEYGQNVSKAYHAVSDIWLDWGLFLLP